MLYDMNWEIGFEGLDGRVQIMTAAPENAHTNVCHPTTLVIDNYVASQPYFNGATTVSANITHRANVVIIICFFTNGYGVSSVTVGGAAATTIGSSNGVYLYSIVRGKPPPKPSTAPIREDGQTQDSSRYQSPEAAAKQRTGT